MAGRKAGTAVQATRLLYLFAWMRKRGEKGVTTSQIAHRFGVSSRQAVRDVDVVASVFPVTWDTETHTYMLDSDTPREAVAS